MKKFNKIELKKMNQINNDINLIYQINRCGNPVFKNDFEKFTLRKTDNGKYLWSRYNYKSRYSHPLNMKRLKTIKYSDNNIYRPYNTSMSEFNTIEKAIEYFNNYLNKYRNKNGES